MGQVTVLPYLESKRQKDWTAGWYSKPFSAAKASHPFRLPFRMVELLGVPKL